jgi:hypothetical protein
MGSRSPDQHRDRLEHPAQASRAPPPTVDQAVELLGDVRRAQPALGQKNRRTVRRIETGRPLTGRSSNRRW